MEHNDLLKDVLSDMFEVIWNLREKTYNSPAGPR
jgi:hypothetical protein